MNESNSTVFTTEISGSNYVYMCVGMMAIGCNLLLILTILTNRADRNNFQRNTVSMSSANVIFGLYAISAGFYRLKVAESGEMFNSIGCSWIQAFSCGLSVLIPFQVSFMSLDSFFATKFPTFYYYNSKSAKFLFAHVGIWLLSLIIAVAGPVFGLSNSSSLTFCNSSTVFALTYYSLVKSLGVTLTALAAVLYFLTLFFSFKRPSSDIGQTSKASEDHQAREKSILRSVVSLILLIVIFGIVPNVLLQLTVRDKLKTFEISSYLGCFQCLGCCLPLPVYMINIPTVRHDILHFLKCREVNANGQTIKPIHSHIHRINLSAVEHS